MNREQTIIRTSIIGILANVLLAAFKAVIGLMSHSIAIVLDAVNNISDAGSSIITIVGTKLAGKPADRKHPYGHGRVEYLTAMIIAVIIIYAGVTSLVESVKKIMSPDIPDYSATSLIIVASAVLVKVVLGLYVRRTGERVNSDSLINSGTDALMDSIISLATLIAAIVYLTAGLSLEAWLGAVIAIVIIKAGVDMLRETISKILGERVDPELTDNIKKTIMEFDDVKGVYDLILHNYGPETYSGSVHIEVDDDYTARDLDGLIRSITQKVYSELGVIMTGVGIYSSNSNDEHAMRIKKDLEDIAFSHDNVLQIHGFYVDEETKTIRFDLIISFDEKDRVALFRHIVNDIHEKYPEYSLIPVLDADFSES